MLSRYSVYRVCRVQSWTACGSHYLCSPGHFTVLEWKSSWGEQVEDKVLQVYSSSNNQSPSAIRNCFHSALFKAFSINNLFHKYWKWFKNFLKTKVTSLFVVSNQKQQKRRISWQLVLHHWAAVNLLLFLMWRGQFTLWLMNNFPDILEHMNHESALHIKLTTQRPNVSHRWDSEPCDPLKMFSASKVTARLDNSAIKYPGRSQQVSLDSTPAAHSTERLLTPGR